MRRRRALQAVGGCIVGTLAGCVAGGRVFETYRYEKDAPIDGPEVTPWRTRAYDARRSGHIPYGGLPSTMAVSQFDFARQPIEMQPAFVDGIAYFGARQAAPENIGRFGPSGLKAADNRGDGWFFRENSPLASPTVAGNAIFVTSDGMTRALDRRDGTLCWAYHEGAGYPAASPTIVDGTVYVTGERVFALAAPTGEVQWATTRPDARLRGTAATEDGVFATAGSGGRGAVYRFDPETGREQWATPTSSEVLVPPVLGEFVYVVEADGRLLALDPSDGREAWSRGLGGRSSAMPAVAGGVVYAVATTGNTLRAIDGDTGELLWQFAFNARRVIGPTVADDSVYLPAGVENGGVIYDLGASSGEVRRTHELPGAPVTPLVVGISLGLIGTGSPSSMTRLQFLSYPESGPFPNESEQHR